MKKNTFLVHLDTLKPSEVKKFGEYLNLKHSNAERLLKAYNYYAKFYKKAKPPPELELAFQEINIRKHKSESELKYLSTDVSDLFQRLKEFLIQEKILETKFEKEFLWLQILEERKLEHQKNLHLTKLKKEKKGIKCVWDSVHQFKLNQYECFSNDFQKNDVELQVLQNGMKYLDDFYINMKLKYSSEILNREHVLSTPPSEPFLLDPLLFSIKEDSYDFTIQNKLYSKLYSFLQKKDFKEHVSLKKFVTTNEDSLHQEERLTAFVYMMNGLAKELQKETQHIEEAFELYQMGLGKDKLLVYNGLMDNTHFFNIVNLACRLKKFDWVKKFIIDNKQYLKKETAKQSVAYVQAVVSFEEGNFQKAIQGLEETTFNDVILEMIARIYLLASHFELENYDDLERLCDSFIRFVKRNKNYLGKTRTQRTVNFTKYLKQLMLKKTQQYQLKENITKDKTLFFRGWLLAKVEEYKPI